MARHRWALVMLLVAAFESIAISRAGANVIISESDIDNSIYFAELEPPPGVNIRAEDVLFSDYFLTPDLIAAIHARPDLLPASYWAQLDAFATSASNLPSFVPESGMLTPDGQLIITGTPWDKLQDAISEYVENLETATGTQFTATAGNSMLAGTVSTPYFYSSIGPPPTYDNTISSGTFHSELTLVPVQITAIPEPAMTAAIALSAALFANVRRRAQR
jgi:hypothetical protein